MFRDVYDAVSEQRQDKLCDSAMSKLREVALDHLGDLLKRYDALPARDNGYGGSDRFDGVLQTRLQQAVERWAPVNSPYHQAGTRLDGTEATDKWGKACIALFADIEAGYLENLEEEVHASTNSELLGIAEGILESNHLLPAAAVMGVLLEQHLKELCRKHLIQVEKVTANGRVKPLTGSDLNLELKAKQVYNASKHDVINGLLKIRNSAVHGNEDDLVESDVRAMLPDLRRFVDEYPA